MATLLLRLAAPLQSWGDDSKFDVRQTAHEPSKSGVVGLLASALGRSREDSVDDLAALRFGVRTVREGRLLCDYHTVSRNPNPRPALNKSDYITRRYYLSDAVFVAGFQGDPDVLRTLEAALCAPAHPLYLGRRSCPPVPPVCLGVVDSGLEEALLQAQCPETLTPINTGKPLRLVLDAEPGTRGALLRDLPVTFSQRRREHGFRPVVERFVPVPSGDHDAFGELEVDGCT